MSSSVRTSETTVRATFSGRYVVLVVSPRDSCAEADSFGSLATAHGFQCTADLPQALRLGRVEVSCEGWSRPGDKNVLQVRPVSTLDRGSIWAGLTLVILSLQLCQGSCGLEYSLFKDSGGIGEGHRDSGFCSSDGGFTLSLACRVGPLTYRVASSAACAGFLTTMFNVLFFAVLALIVVSFIRAFLGDRRRRPDSSLTDSPPPPYTPGPGGPPGGKSPRPTQDPAVPGWRPGFWTGLGLASVGGWLWNLTRPRATTGEYPQRQRPYQPSYGGVDDPFRRDEDDQHRWNQPGPSRHAGRSHQRDDGDSGGLGRVRQSVGFGGSSVR